MNSRPTTAASAQIAVASQQIFISEILFNSPSADTGNEYIELRGTPNSTVASDTYLLTIDGESGNGIVDHIFDLSGMQFGTNGFLVLFQVGTPYTADANAMSTTATGSGWGTDFSDRTNDLENGSNSFLLIESVVAPVADEDVDSDSDGVLDGGTSGNWTILDSVGILDGDVGDTAYGAINFSANGNGLSSELIVNLQSKIGSSFIPGYLGRIASSTGATTADWMAGVLEGTAPNFNLIAGQTIPASLDGQALDHIGTTNPTGSDTTAPGIVTLEPADDVTDVIASTELVMTFDENVQKGTGNLTIHLAADDSVVQTIDVTTTAVSVDSGTVTINPPTDLTPGTTYYVNIPAGAIEDITSNPFAGIIDTTSWNFTTAPNALSVSLDGSNNLVISETGGATADDLTIRFDGTTVTITVAVGATVGDAGVPGISGADTSIVTIPLASITGLQIIINTGDGDDRLTIDLGDNSNPFTKEIVFNGQGQTIGDSLVLTGTATVSDLTFGFLSENDGTIDLTSNAQITYTGLEPITSTINAVSVTLNFSTTAEIITVGDTGNGQTTVDSDVGGETVTFNNPTDTLTINAGDTGINTINIGALASNYPANLAINGGDGGDTVNLNGAITFTADKSLSVDALTVNAPNAASDIATNGMGRVAITATRNITFNNGASLTTVDGGIALNANTAGTTTGDFTGITINEGIIATSGNGDITLTATSGDSAGNDGIHIALSSGNAISSTGTGASAGTITLNGASQSSDNNGDGILVEGNLASVDGAIYLTGYSALGNGISINNQTLASTGTGSNAATITLDGISDGTTTSVVGVNIDATTVTAVDGDITVDGLVNSGGSGILIGVTTAISSTGTGIDAANIVLSGTNTVENRGIMWNGASAIAAIDGDITLIGATPGISPSGADLYTASGAIIGGPTMTGDITLLANTLRLSTITIQSSGDLHITPRTPATTIGLGGGTGTLNLVASELATLQDGFNTITIGDVLNGTGAASIEGSLFTDLITIVAGSIDIDGLNAGTNDVLLTARTGSITDGTSGTDVTGGTVTLNSDVTPGASPGQLIVDGDLTLSSSETLTVEIVDVIDPGIDYDQIQVTGANRIVDLNNTNLNLTVDGGYAPMIGDQFVIIDNVDATSTISGTFNGLAEGAAVTVNGTDFILTYAGGDDANDVVLLIPAVSVNGTIYSTLQQAIDNANPYDTIRIISGTYTAQADVGSFIQMGYITKSLTIEGGCNTTFTTCSPTTPTIMDGGGGGRGFVISGTIQVTLTNLIITGNDTTEAGGDLHGGGILIQGSDVTLLDTQVTGNAADFGGGVYLGSTLTCGPGCSIDNNLAIDGGGVFVNSTGLTSALILSGGQIVTNTAFDNGGGVFVDDVGAVYTQTSGLIGWNIAGIDGGGVYVNEGMATLSGGSFIYNYAEDFGGGLYASPLAILSIMNTDFLTNTAFNDDGGGLFVDGDVTVTGGLFQGNDAVFGGGLAATASATVSGTQFVNNYAVNLGGGAITLDASLENALFQENLSDSEGGGLYADNVTMTNTDFLTNTTFDFGGGISTITATLQGGLFQGNSVDDGAGSGFGGGLYAFGPVTIVDTQFINNSAVDDGGGLQADGPVIVTGGLFQGNHSDNDGGGMDVQDDVTLVATNFISNTSGDDGGGLYTFFTADVTGGLFQSNDAVNHAGGLYVADGATIRGTTFINNTSVNDGGGLQADGPVTVIGALFQENISLDDGGGIDVQNELTLINTTLISNTSGDDGGGAYALFAINVTGGLIQNNSAADYGGGIISRGFTTIDGTEFISNTAQNDGGGLLSSGPADIVDAMFIGNRSDTRGGGMALEEFFFVERTLFDDNQAPQGGGLFHWTVTSCGVDNDAESCGGGFFGVNPSFAVNNIFANNGATLGGAIMISDTVTTVAITHNTIVSQTTGTEEAIYLVDAIAEIVNTIITNYATGITNNNGTASEDYNLFFTVATPLSGTFTSGGNTVVDVDPRFVDAANGDYSLDNSSPAIDTGNFVNVTDDFASNFRPQGATVDRGAREAAATNLALTKRSTATANAGEVITYTLTVRNEGAEAATNVTITDTLPANVAFSQAITHTGGSCGTGTTVITCTVPTLTGATAISFTLIVTADSAIAPGSSLENVAVVDSDLPEAMTSDNTATADTAILSSAELTLDKVASPATTVMAGQWLTYTIVVTNSGPAVAQDVVIYDNLPAGLTLLMALAQREGDALPANCGDPTCAVGDLTVGQRATVTLFAHVDADLSDSTVLTNTASVFSTSLENELSDNESSAVVTISSVADLAVSKTGTLTATIGGPIQYQLLLENNGPADALGVVVSDTLPAAMESATVSSSDLPADACGITNNLVTCTIASLAVGAVVAIDIDATVSATTTVNTITNTVTVTSTNDLTGATDTSVTTLAAEADLTLNKSATATIYAGETITYTLSVLNNGPSVASNVTVTDTLPSGVTLASVTGGDSCGSGSNPITCTVSGLAPGDEMTVTIVVTTSNALAPGTSLANSAIVASATTESDNSNNQAAADTAILSKAELTLQKSGPLTVTAGLPFSYTVVITNRGPSVAQNVVIVDDLPNGLTLISATDARNSGTTPVLCGGTSCQVGDVTVNEMVTVTLAVLANSALGDGATLTNTATVFSDSLEDELSDNSASVTTTIETEAELTISKIDLTDPVGPTDGLLYEIVVRNDGPSDAQTVMVTDTLDSNVTFTGASAGCLQSGTDVICTVGTLAADAYATYLVSVRVNDVVSGTLLTNVVTATTATTDPTLPNTESVTTTVQTVAEPSADLSMTKLGSPATVNAGEEVTYTLAISNVGPQAATNVRIIELVPSGTSIVTMTVENPNAPSAFCGLGGSCYLGEVISGTNVATVTVVLAVDADYTGTTILNQAHVSGDQRDPDASNNLASATTAVTNQANLAIAKSAPAEAIAGEVILYQVTITNTGPSMAYDVVISDTSPLSTTFVMASPFCGESGGLVNCAMSELAAGASTSALIQVRVDTDIISPTTILNTATVTATNAAMTMSDSATTTATQAALNPTTLVLLKVVTPTTVNAGEQITYTLTVTNVGPALATNVRLVDVLPLGVSVDTATASQGACTLAGVCELGDLAVSGTATVNLVATIESSTPAGTLANQAVAAAANPDSYVASNVVSTTVTVSPTQGILKMGPAEAEPGAAIAYQIVITNSGPSDVPTVVVSDTLPTTLNNLTAAASQGSCAITSGLLTCSLGSLAAGGTAFIAVNGYIDGDATGVITNTAAIVGTGLTSTVTTTLSLDADLALRKDATPTVDAGESITYTLAVYNNGPSPAINVTVTDMLPSGVALVSATGGDGCGSGPNPVTCTIGTLASGEWVTFTLVVTTSGTLAPGTSLENMAIVGADTADSDASNNQAVADTTILSRAELALSKSGPGTITAGALVTYTLVATNSGPSVAQSVRIADNLPTGLTFESALIERTGGAPALCGGPTCQVGNMAVGEVVTITLTALSASSLSDGATITNTATIFSDSDELDTGDNSDQVTATVTTDARLTITKRDLVDPVVVSAIGNPNELTYLITIRSDGLSNASTVIFTDTLPAGVESSALPILNASYAPAPDATACSPAGSRAVSCDLGTIPTGETIEILLGARVIDDAGLCGTTATNTGTVSWQESSGQASASDSATTDLLCQGDIDLQKVGPTDLNFGDSAQYTLTINNIGSSPIATGTLELTEFLPAELAYTGIATQSGSCAFADPGAASGPTTLNFTNSAPLGVSEFCQVVLDVTLHNDSAVCSTGFVFNQAQGTVDDQTDDMAQATWLTTVACATTLAISKDPDFDIGTELLAGTQVDYLIAITNTGVVTAFDLELTDHLSSTLAGAQIIDMDSNGTEPSGACINGGYCQLNDLAPNSAITVVATVAIASDMRGATLAQEACVAATNATQVCDSVSGSVQANAVVTMTKATLYAPFIVRDSGLVGEISDDGHYQLQIANPSIADAETVVISDVLPLGMVVSNAPIATASYADMDINCAGSVGTNVLNCTLSQPLPAGKTIDLIVPVGFDATVANPADFCGTQITNQAFVSWGDDFDPANNQNSSNILTTNVICQGAIDLQKSAPAVVDYTDAVNSGFAYTFTVRNIGTSPVITGDITITDVLPSGLNFVTQADAGSCGLGSSISGSTLIMTNAFPLAAGDACTTTFLVTLDDDPAICTTNLIANSAQATVGTFPFATDQALALTAINCAAALEIDKTIIYANGATAASPGDVITFTLTLTNSGPAPAVGVVVQDLPINLDTTLIDTQAPISYTQSAGLTFIRNGALAVNGTDHFTLTMRLNDTVAVGTNPSNSAYASADNAETATTSVPVAIAPSADLRVVKSALANTVLAGDIVYFHIEVSNDGPADLLAPSSAFTLTDLVTGVGTIESVSGALCTIDSSTAITCSELELRSGDKLDLLVGVRADGNAAHQSILTNTAQIDLAAISGFTDTVSLNNSAIATVTVTNATATLTLNKVLASAETVAGTVVSYTITVTNSGLYTATDIAMTDNLTIPVSTGARIVNVAIADNSFGYVPQGGECIDSGYCALPDLPPSATISVLVQVAIDSDQVGNLLENAACVGATNANQVCDSTSDAITASAMLAITKSAPMTVTAGSQIAYTLVISNAGPSDAQSVVVTDTLAATLANGQATALNQPNACTVSGNNLTCALGTLTAGAATTIDIVADVTANATGIITNTAYLTSITALVSPVASNETSTIVESNADLVLSKAATATVIAGEPITYTLGLYNNGPADAQNVVVTDTLPNDVILASATGGDGCGTGPNPVTCTVSTLAAGEWVTFTLVVTTSDSAAPGTSLENIAVVSADTADSDASNNTATADTTVLSRAALVLDKRGPLTVTSGTELTYTIVMTNNGPSVAQNVVIADDLPDGLTLINATATGSSGSRSILCSSVSCQIGDVPVGEVVTVTLIVLADTDLADGTTLTNTATVFSDSLENDLNDNSDSVSTLVETEADLSVSKVDLTDPVGPTDGLFYEIVVRNDGPSAAQSVVVTDTFDSNVTFIGASAGCLQSGTDVICTVGTLAADAYATYLVSVRVNDVVSGTLLTNVVTATTATTDPTLPNTASVTTTVQTVAEPTADLSMTKLGSPATVNAGEQVTYTLAISNLSLQSVTNVRVIELIPYGTAIVTMTVENLNDLGAFCGLGGTCYLGEVISGTSVATVTVVLAVDADYTGSTILNQAHVSGDQRDPDMSNNLASATTVVTSQANLAIAKSAPAEALAGEVILYQVTITNTGPSHAYNVVISDTLPLSTTFATASPLCRETSSVVSCNLGDLAVNATASVLIQARIDRDLSSAMTILNTAVVSATNATLLQATATTSVLPIADDAAVLAVTKLATPPTVNAGEAITYTLTVTNTGPERATSVRLVDAFPLGVQIVAATASQGQCTLAGVCELGDLDVNAQVTVRFVAQVESSTTPSILSNQAVVAAINLDSHAASNVVTTTVTVSATLGIIKNGPSTVRPEDAIAYQIVVSNDGPSDAASVVVSDTLPTAIENVMAAASQGRCIISGELLACDLGDVTAGEVVMIAVNGYVASDAPGSFTNRAEILGTGLSSSVTTGVQRDADLSLQKSATATVSAGEPITYTLALYNAGPSRARNIEVMDTLPVGVILRSATGGDGCTAGNPVICNAATLAADEWVTFTIVVDTDVTLALGTSLENVATVSAGTPDRNPTNDRATADTSIVGRAELTLQKSGAPTVTAGTELTYTIVAVNNGPSAAQGVIIEDTLPTNLQFRGATLTRMDNTVTPCGGTICPVGTLAANETVTLTLSAVASADLTANTVLTNTATVLSNTTEDSLSDNHDMVTTTVTTMADLSVVKIDLQDPVEAMSGFMYEIAVTNAGPSDAANVVVTDTLGSDLSFVGISPDCAVNSGEIVCALPTLQAGQTVRYLLTAQTGDVPDGTVLQNTIAVQSDTPDPALTNNVDTETTTVQTSVGRSADLALSKVALASRVNAGDTVTYTLVVSNAGPTLATDVQVLEHFPPETTIADVIVNNPDDALAFCSTGGVCTLGRLQPGTTATITLQLKVGLAFADTVLHNSAAVTGDQADYVPENNVDSADVAVNPAPQLLVIEKGVDRAVALAGESLVYTIRVMNNGPVLARNVRITDTLPSGVTYVEDTLGCGPTLNNCLLGDLAPNQVGSFQVVVTIADDIACDSSLINSVQLGADNVVADPTTNQASVLVVVSCDADLSISGLAIPSGDVAAGQTVRYRLLVDNLGPSVGQGVTLDLDLVASGPVTLTQLLADADGNQPTASCNTEAPIALDAIQPRLALSCTLNAPLPVQSTQRVQRGELIGLELLTHQRTLRGVSGRWAVELDVSADRPLDVNLVATVTGQEPESRLENNQTILQTGFVCNEQSNADLGLTKTLLDPRNAAPGVVLIYELMYANYTTEAMGCVRLLETVPEQNVFVAADSDPRWTCLDGAPAGTRCQLYLGTVDGGATGTVTFAARLAPVLTGRDAVTITNIAEIQGSPTEPNLANNVAFADLMLAPTVLDDEEETAKSRQIYLPIIQR